MLLILALIAAAEEQQDAPVVSSALLRPTSLVGSTCVSQVDDPVANERDVKQASCVDKFCKPERGANHCKFCTPLASLERAARIHGPSTQPTLSSLSTFGTLAGKCRACQFCAPPSPPSSPRPPPAPSRRAALCKGILDATETICCTAGCGQSRKQCAETADVCDGTRRGDQTTKANCCPSIIKEKGNVCRASGRDARAPCVLPELLPPMPPPEPRPPPAPRPPPRPNHPKRTKPPPEPAPPSPPPPQLPTPPPSLSPPSPSPGAPTAGTSGAKPAEGGDGTAGAKPALSSLGAVLDDPRELLIGSLALVVLALLMVVATLWQQLQQAKAKNAPARAQKKKKKRQYGTGSLLADEDDLEKIIDDQDDLE